MEQRLPAFCRGQEYGHKHRSDGTDDGVQKCGKGQRVVRSLQFLYRLMKVDDTVEERKDFRAECGYISHGPVMSIEDSKEKMEPASVDKRPGHEWQERHPKRVYTQGVDIFCQH